MGDGMSVSGKAIPIMGEVLSGRDGESNTNPDRWKLTAKTVYRCRVGNPAHPSIPYNIQGEMAGTHLTIR